METVIAGVRIYGEFLERGQLPAEISDDVFIVMRVCVESPTIPDCLKFGSRCSFFGRPLVSNFGEGLQWDWVEEDGTQRWGKGRFITEKARGKTFAECRRKLIEKFQIETTCLAIKVGQREAALQEAGE